MATKKSNVMAFPTGGSMSTPKGAKAAAMPTVKAGKNPGMAGGMSNIKKTGKTPKA